MSQESVFWGHFFALCTAGLLELPEALPWTHGGLTATLRSPAAPANDLRSWHIVPSAGYHFHPCLHDKFGPPH